MRPAVILLVAVSAIPAIAGLAAALFNGLDADALGRVFASPGVWRSLLLSCWSGILATSVSLGLAHLALALAASGGWRRRLDRAVMPFLALPHLAIGIGLALVLAPSGLLLRLVSPWLSGLALPPDWLTVGDPAAITLTLGLVLKESCFLILALTAALAQVPSDRLLAQAQSLGYGPLKGWFVSVAPLLQRQVRLPLAAVLVYSVTNVEVAIPLGPDLPPTFAVMLWRWFVDPAPDVRAQAYAGTLVLLAATVLVLAFAALAGWATRSVLGRAARSGGRRSRERVTRRVSITILGLLWALGIVSLGAIVLRSLSGVWRFPTVMPGNGALAAWRDLLPIAGSVAGTTLGLALVVALVGLALVLPAAEVCRTRPGLRRRTGTLLFVPLLVPQMTFLFGVQVLLARLGIDGTLFAVLWSHLLFALPYLWGVIAPARAALDPRYERVARTLGASPRRAWLTVVAPLIARPMLIAAALAFSVSVALYLPTLFAGAGRIATAATEAAAAAASGNLRLAATHTILLALAPLAAFAAAFASSGYWFRHKRGVA